MCKLIEYDRATAERLENIVDVLSPQETANIIGKPIIDGETIYYPTATED